MSFNCSIVVVKTVLPNRQKKTLSNINSEISLYKRTKPPKFMKKSSRVIKKVTFHRSYRDLTIVFKLNHVLITA